MDTEASRPDRVFVFGKKPGRTTLFALDAEGEPIVSRTVAVGPDQTELQRTARESAGTSAITLDPTARGAILRGTVPDAGAAASLMAIAGSDGPVLNGLRIVQPTQVNLRVRTGPCDRAISHADDPSLSLDSLGRCVQDNNLAEMLADPRDLVQPPDAGPAPAGPAVQVIKQFNQAG